MEEILDKKVTKEESRDNEMSKEGNELENKINIFPLENMGSQRKNVETPKSKIGDNLDKMVYEQLSKDTVETQNENEVKTVTETEIAMEKIGNSEIVSFKGGNVAVNTPFKLATKSIHLGISQKVLGVCLDKSHATILTILLLIIFSCGDSGTDLGMALSFFQANFYTEAYLILATDYLPVFLTLLHFFMSSMTGSMPFSQKAMLAAVFIILNPFMPAICNFLWLVCRISRRWNQEDYYHYLAKVTSGIQGTFEERIFLSPKR